MTHATYKNLTIISVIFISNVKFQLNVHVTTEIDFQNSVRNNFWQSVCSKK